MADGKSRKNVCKLNILGYIVSRDFVTKRFLSLELSSLSLNLELFQIIKNHNETLKKHFLQHQVCKVKVSKKFIEPLLRFSKKCANWKNGLSKRIIS